MRPEGRVEPYYPVQTEARGVPDPGERPGEEHPQGQKRTGLDARQGPRGGLKRTEFNLIYHYGTNKFICSKLIYWFALA